MNAVSEVPRLYSKPVRAPVDEISERHGQIHAELERWGAWNADRYKAGTSGSVESRYREQLPPATGQDVDPRMIQLERAVLAMPAQYRDTVRMFYVSRMDPRTICRVFTLRYEVFPAWMATCRAMVLNILRRNGN